MNLRLRLTLMSSIILSIACVILTLAVNFSADKAIILAVPLEPQISENIVGEEIKPSILTPATQYELFRTESISAMIFVVLAGSIATYFIAGQTLKPLKKLTNEIKNKTVNNLHEKLTLPRIKDEIFEISTAFNDMSHNLEQSFRLQEQFSADAAHELRTPLAVMIAKIEVFKLDEQIAKGSTLSMINELGLQLDRLSNLTNDLLWFSKDLPLKNKRKINLYQLFLDLNYELFERLEEKNIKISIEEKELVVCGDDALLERVFFNLLENAIKYSCENSTILIKLEQTQKKSMVKIIDSGEGISDEEKQLVFEPFYRIHKSRNHRIGGNGLGLPICKKILDRHLASIEIKDNHPCGSIFEITFLS